MVNSFSKVLPKKGSAQIKAKEQIVELDPNTINVSPSWRKERRIDPDKLQLRIDSIAKEGQRDAICVRKAEDGSLEIVYGKHRLLATKELGIKVKAIVRNLTIAEARDASTFENADRTDLSPLEHVDIVLDYMSRHLGLSEVEIKRTMRKIVKKKATEGMDIPTLVATYERVSRVGVSTFVTDYLPLLKLPPELLSLARDGELAFSKLVVIKDIKDKGLRDRLVELTKENKSPFTVAVLKEIKKAARKDTDLGKGLTEAFSLGKLTKEMLIMLCKAKDPNLAYKCLDLIEKKKITTLEEVKAKLAGKKESKAVAGLKKDCNRIFKMIGESDVLTDKTKSKELHELLMQIEALMEE